MSSVANGTVTMGVVAGMHANMPSFSHPCACHPYLSLSAHAVIDLCSCPPSLICALMYPCQSKSMCMLIVHVPAHLSTLGCTGWPSLAPPALIRTHCCFFVLISILLLDPVCLSTLGCAGWVGLHSCSLPLVCLCSSLFFCWSLFVPLGCTGQSSCISLLVHVFRCMLISICLLAPVCPCPFVSTQLCWFLLGCTCSCYLIALVWLSLMLIGVHLGLFVLV